MFSKWNPCHEYCYIVLFPFSYFVSATPLHFLYFRRISFNLFNPSSSSALITSSLPFDSVNLDDRCYSVVPGTYLSSTLARRQGGAKRVKNSLTHLDNKSDAGSLNDFGSISDLGHASVYSTDLSADLDLSTLSSPQSFDIGFPSMRSFGNKML